MQGRRDNSFWTAEREERLRLMVAAKYSYREIGHAIGCSRNAAIGKARRLGIEPVRTVAVRRKNQHAHPVAKRHAPRPRAVNVKRVLRRRKEAQPPVEQPVSTSVEEIARERVVVVGGKTSWMHYRTGERTLEPVRWTNEVTRTMACWECFEPVSMCHWPVQSNPVQFCGAQRACYNNSDELTPYCARHYRRSISRKEEK